MQNVSSKNFINNALYDKQFVFQTVSDTAGIYVYNRVAILRYERYIFISEIKKKKIYKYYRKCWSHILFFKPQWKKEGCFKLEMYRILNEWTNYNAVFCLKANLIYDHFICLLSYS